MKDELVRLYRFLKQILVDIDAIQRTIRLDGDVKSMTRRRLQLLKNKQTEAVATFHELELLILAANVDVAKRFELAGLVFPTTYHGVLELLARVCTLGAVCDFGDAESLQNAVNTITDREYSAAFAGLAEETARCLNHLAQIGSENFHSGTEEQPDGPLIGDSWLKNGEVIGGMPHNAWRLAKELWDVREETDNRSQIPFDELELTKRDKYDGGELREFQRQANGFFNRHEINLHIKVSVANEFVAMVPRDRR